MEEKKKSELDIVELGMRGQFAQNVVTLIKKVFDKLDQGDGRVAKAEMIEACWKHRGLRQLNKILTTLLVHVTAPTAKNTNVALSFPDVLKLIYSRVKKQELQVMLKWTDHVTVGPGHINQLSTLFDLNDLEFIGELRFQEFWDVVKSQQHQLELSETVNTFEAASAKAKAAQKKNPQYTHPLLFDESELMTLNACLSKIFFSIPKMLPSIMKWSNPRRPLTRDQYFDLQKLFESYDTDGGGSITLDEIANGMAGGNKHLTTTNHAFEILVFG